MNRLEVVAALLQSAEGRFLLAQRPAGKAYAGYWEFPGGKIEPGESADRALARELHEELGITVRGSYAWLTREYDYEHAAVRLRFRRVLKWTGALHGREGQQFAWQTPGDLSVSPVLPANGPILAALKLPYLYGISNAAEVGIDRFLRRLELALQSGLRLLQIREKSLPPEQQEAILVRSLALARRYGALVVFNGEEAIARHGGADGLHLPASELVGIPVRPPFELVGASCHDDKELARAAALELDFVVVGPVRETASHPGAPTLGWARFAKLIENTPLPVYAIGGLRGEDLETAWDSGAHGIAAIRGSWTEV